MEDGLAVIGGQSQRLSVDLHYVCRWLKLSAPKPRDISATEKNSIRWKDPIEGFMRDKRFFLTKAMMDAL